LATGILASSEAFIPPEISMLIVSYIAGMLIHGIRYYFLSFEKIQRLKCCLQSLLARASGAFLSLPLCGIVIRGDKYGRQQRV
jgi:uncharacterized membrane protein (DUF106 family)